MPTLLRANQLVWTPGQPSMIFWTLIAKTTSSQEVLSNLTISFFSQSVAPVQEFLSTVIGHIESNREEQEWAPTPPRVTQDYQGFDKVHNYCRAPVQSIVDSTPYSMLTEQSALDVVSLYRFLFLL